jgi:hypothetical protein
VNPATTAPTTDYAAAERDLIGAALFGLADRVPVALTLQNFLE